jgi:hypothetical protein
MRIPTLVVIATCCVACSGGERRFPLREPMWRDTDLDPVHAHIARYESPLYWDGADNLVFRPLSDALGLVTSGESVNVNSLDEVPDSAWFTNRIGTRGMTPDEVARGACTPEQVLDAEHAPDGSWLVDKGKTSGSTPGFRVSIPGKGKFMLKAEDKDNAPERQAASSVIGAAVFHAAGYWATCEQIVYVRPALFAIKPGLVSKANFQDEKPFDRAALDHMLAQSTIHGRVRMSASAWIAGQSIGEYRFSGTRKDDPNDVIPHEDRRDLRGMRVLAAWLDRFDAREGNTFDTWMASDSKRTDSPGIVLHYQLDMSETLGSTWAWEEISRRLGKSYVIDWGDLARDFVTLGIPLRPWDTARREPGREIFGYFDTQNFSAGDWKSEYPNAAFSRMTERDGAWMARILARFTPEMIHALAKTADFSDERHTRFLEVTLEGRLERVLDRWLSRVSPIADVKLDGGDSLCGVDLAMLRGVRPASAFRFTARVVNGQRLAATSDGARVCVKVPHGAAYIRVAIDDGFAKGPLVAHVYDLNTRGFALAGIERP